MTVRIINLGPITPSTGVGVGRGGIGVGVGVGQAATAGDADANSGAGGCMGQAATWGLAIVCAPRSCAANKQRKALSKTFFFTNSPCSMFNHKK